MNDLSPLSGLTALQRLVVYGTQVSDLSPLSGLTALQQLSAFHTKVSDLRPLSGLTALLQLDVSDTQVNDLTPLSGLTALLQLDVSGTQVSDLSPLSGLTVLRWVRVFNTPVSDLSPLLALIKKGIPVKWNWLEDGICVADCPLTTPPVAIVKQGNKAILNYFKEKQSQGVDYLYEAKMLLVGEGGAGKTSLVRRLYQPEKDLPAENETTKGIDIYRHSFNVNDKRSNKVREFYLNVWDFGGQEIYHATHQFFLTQRSLYILLDDTRKDDKTVHDEAFKYWLEVVDLLSEHSPVLIFQNEKGGRSKSIDFAGIKSKYANVKEKYAGNLEVNHAVADLRNAIELFAQQLPHIGEELPAKWIEIRAEIEMLAERQPTISQQQYFDLYQKHLDFDKEKALHLSCYLHDLGVFLHFQDDDLLGRTVILQNTWATEAVFKMLDDEKVKSRLGRFSDEDCRRIWQDSDYAEMHPELRALMEKFELCYLLPDSKPKTWLAPQLLPPSKPEQLNDWEQVGDLVLRYRYQFLPKGMINRLMVRKHYFVSRPEMAWLTGVLFERNGTQVLVELSPRGEEIVLRARGVEQKELLSAIATDLDTLNYSFKGLAEKVSVFIPCCCLVCQKLTEPEAYEKKRLLKRKQDGKATIECPGSYEDVSVIELLDGIQLENTLDLRPGDLKKIFISYSKHDSEHKDKLLNHLSCLRNQIITS